MSFGISVLAKPAGAICNLDCAYCYYLAKQSLYPHARFKMTDGVLERFLRQCIEVQPGPVATIAWQGGEPTLMGLEFFRRAVEIADRYRRPGQSLEHVLQTNGTLLNEEWADFLAAHDFLVGISIDGPRELHDALRTDKRGRPTFGRVTRGLTFLRRAGVRYNVLCAVNAVNAGRPRRVYRFLRDECGSEFMQFIPIVQRASAATRAGAVTEASVSAAAWGTFLIEVFDEWIAGDVGKVFVQMFESTLGSWMGLGPALCVFGKTCGASIAVEHNGDVYSCDHFVDPEHLLGSIRGGRLVDLVSSERQRAFGDDKHRRLPAKCRSCRVLPLCWGECPRNRFVTTDDGEEGLNYLCAGYEAYFRHTAAAMRAMAALLVAGRPAADVMAMASAPLSTHLCKGGPTRPPEVP